MGSSDRAGNRGQPATPRDGAAVELQGLALFVADKLAKLSNTPYFPHAYMEGMLYLIFKYPTTILYGNTSWNWNEWAAKIRQSFPQKFFVEADNNEKYINRKRIIKDSFGSTAGFTDFQLRPNFCIALDAVVFYVANSSWATYMHK